MLVEYQPPVDTCAYLGCNEPVTWQVLISDCPPDAVFTDDAIAEDLGSCRAHVGAICTDDPHLWFVVHGASGTIDYAARRAMAREARIAQEQTPTEPRR